MNINNPYKMNWVKGTKVKYIKAPLLVSDKYNNDIKSSEISNRVKEGEILEIIRTNTATVPYADIYDSKGAWHMVDLRNLEKV